MQVDFAFLADTAVATPDGKISAIGLGFENLGAAEFPTTVPNMSFVVRLFIHPAECDRAHTLAIQLWNPDGAIMDVQIEATFTGTKNILNPTGNASLPLVLNLRDVVFPAPGSYAFHVIVDGTHLKEVPLHLMERQRLFDAMAGQGTT